MSSLYFIQIRKEQLKQLYQTEEDQYIAELKGKGLALYKDRL